MYISFFFPRYKYTCFIHIVNVVVQLHHTTLINIYVDGINDDDNNKNNYSDE